MHIGRDGLELKRSSPEILINNLKVKIMKKMLVVLLFLMGSIHVGNAVNVEAALSDECFDVAIGALQDMEDSLGFALNDRDATEFLNERYMLCWCLYHIEYCLDNW